MENNESQDFIVTHPLYPTGPAEQLFVAGASVFEITAFVPPIQRVTILGINLPEPDTFGPYDSYVATLVTSNSEPLATMFLIPTEDNQNWAASTLLDFGGTLPDIQVFIRPQLGFERVGNIILQGKVFP